MSFVRIVLLSLCLVFPSVSTAQEAPQQSPNQGVYPNNPDGLKSLMTDVFSAVKAKDKATESRLLDSLFLPADSHWFTDQFGPAYGPRMAERYAESTSGLKDQISLIIANDIQHHWDDIQVKEFADSGSSPSPYDRILDNMNGRQSVYQATVTISGQPTFSVMFGGPNHAQTAGDLDGYFFFVDGSFRFISFNVFWILGGGRPMRIHLNPNQMGIAIIKQVNYTYPQEALERHLQGDVVIHLVLDTQGNIKEMTATQGDPILAKTCLDALKQWRFAPTLLDGDAVEVETDFTFKFEMQ